jgi:iron complex outermembrane receptor protein
MELPNRAARTARLLALLLPGAASAQVDLDELVVTGTPHEAAAGDLAQSVTVLRAEALDRARGITLGETLASQLGVTSTYFGAGASRPVIRGLAGARVRTLEDGIDSLDVASVSDDHAVSIDPLFAEQIEIFRGPTTLLYGSGAVGGVINTVTSRIPSAVPEQPLAGAFEVRGDTAAAERSAAARLDGGGGRFAWHVDAVTRSTDDYDIPGFAELHPHEGEVPSGTLENSAVDSDAAAAGFAWFGDRAFVGVALSGFDSLYGVPGGHDHLHGDDEDEQEEREAPVRVDLSQRRIDLKSGWRFASGPFDTIDFRFGRNDYEHIELEGEEVGTRFTNDAYEARLELVHRPFGRFSGAFGAQLTDREFAAIGAEAFVPPVDSRSYGVFAIEQLDVGEWELSFGGRLERQRHEPSNGTPSFSDEATSVSLAGVRRLRGGRSFFVNAARAQRLPVAEELYSDGPHLATRTVQMGAADLDRETARHLDIGIRKETDDFSWSVTGFLTRFADFIHLAATGEENAETELPIFAFTQGDAELVGLEAEVFAPLTEMAGGELDLRLFADFVRGELVGGAPLPRIPPRRLGGRLQFHDERVIVGVEVTRYDAQHRVAPFEEPTPGHTLVSADFRWLRITDGGTQLELFVNGSNLRDVDARRHSSFVKEFVPLPGRNYSVGVRARF